MKSTCIIFDTSGSAAVVTQIAQHCVSLSFENLLSRLPIYELSKTVGEIVVDWRNTCRTCTWFGRCVKSWTQTSLLLVD